MAQIIPASDIPVAKAWLHDVFVWGGITSPKRAITLSNYRYMYGQSSDNIRNKPEFFEAAKTVCEMIKSRKVDVKEFQKYDAAIAKLSMCHFNPSIQSTNRFENDHKSVDELSKYITWFCHENGLYWDNRIASTYEIDEIKKYSTLGKALWAGFCFVKDNDEPNGQEDTLGNAAQQAAPADNTAGPVKKQPQNNFKSRGPLSGVAVDLIGQPNQKVFLKHILYAIQGQDDIGKFLEDCVYIRPVEADQKAQKKYMVGNTNKVLFGSAKGYGYCQCYFETEQEALAFSNKIDWSSMKINTNRVKKIAIGSTHSLSGGYFKVGTEYGPVYISASKLNEDVQEEKPDTALVEETEEPASISVSFNDYAESFFKD